MCQLALAVLLASSSHLSSAVTQVLCKFSPCILVTLQENKAEIKSVWNMFKEDPLSPVSAYWKNYGMPGIGLFLEGYVVSFLCELHTPFAQLAQFAGMLSQT